MEPVETVPNGSAKGEFTVDDPRWLLVRRITRSATFARADRLSKFLLYVCRMHLSGRDGEINEQRIGIDVFRRSPSFDSGADTIVRTHATRLRQKLDLYFNSEGSGEVDRLEIPRGGYIPRFYVESPSETPELIAAAPPVEVLPVEALLPEQTVPVQDRLTTAFAKKTPKHIRSLWLGCGMVAGIVIAVFAMWLGHRTGRLPELFEHADALSRQTAVEHQFWNGLFADNVRSLVVVGDSGLVLYETFGKREVSLSDYIAGTYRRPVGQAAASKGDAAWEQDLPTRRYTSVADLNLAVRFTHLPQWSDQRSEVVFARDLHAVDAAQSNLVLIGSRVANPWVALVDPSMNFALAPDGEGRFAFINRRPAQGERASYLPSQPGSGTTDSSVYALVYYRPEGGGMKKILLLSGLWQSGTEAAGKYVLAAPEFGSFLSRIQKADGSFPQFELLVQVHSVAGNAFASSIIASRVH